MYLQLEYHLYQEGYLEAAGQLVLNISILIISGLQDKVFLCRGDVQIISICLSFLSICKTAGIVHLSNYFSLMNKPPPGEQHFFQRSSRYPPGLKQVACTALCFIVDLVFRVTGIAVICTHLRWFATVPMLAILLANYLSTKHCGITDTGDRVATAAISVVIPSVFVDDDHAILVLPRIQQSYYRWNRNVLATILFMCVGLITSMVNTTYVDHVIPFCHIHALVWCRIAPLHMTGEQFNMIILPLLICSGLITLLPQFCSPRAWINLPLKYEEQIVKDGEGNIKRVEN